MKKIDVKIKKKFGNKLAVDAEFEFELGDFVLLIGENGSGKTTLLCGLAKSIIFEGKINYPKSVSRIGFARQTPHLLNNLPVHENISFFKKMFNSNKENNEFIDGLAADLGLDEFLDYCVADLSEGNKKKLEVLAALINEPQVLLLDEPTSGLDEESARKVLHLLEMLSKENQLTIVVAAHDLTKEFQKLATKTIFLEKGKLVKK